MKNRLDTSTFLLSWILVTEFPCEDRFLITGRNSVCLLWKEKLISFWVLDYSTMKQKGFYLFLQHQKTETYFLMDSCPFCNKKNAVFTSLYSCKKRTFISWWILAYSAVTWMLFSIPSSASKTELIFPGVLACSATKRKVFFNSFTQTKNRKDCSFQLLYFGWQKLIFL